MMIMAKAVVSPPDPVREKKAKSLYIFICLQENNISDHVVVCLKYRHNDVSNKPSHNNKDLSLFKALGICDKMI